MNITISMPTDDVMPSPAEYQARNKVEGELSLPSGLIDGHDMGDYQMCLFIRDVSEEDAATVAHSCVNSLARHNLLAGARIVFKEGFEFREGE